MQGWPVKAIPSGLHYPPIIDVLASGRKVKLAQRKLSRVLSQWYATDDGYVSYYTAGDFRQELTAVQKQARIIMQDTIVNMVERVEGNPQ